MKKNWNSEETNPADDHFWELTRADLDPEEQQIYDVVLPKLASPSAEQLRMLAAYAWAASELKKASQTDDQALSVWLRDCMVYARNGLGIAGPRSVHFMELLLDYKDTWPPVYLSLGRTWQIEE